MLGNMQSESAINPARWQSDRIGWYAGGFGLVQWTPATKYLDWASARSLPYKEMDSNLKRILYEVENGLQWYATSSYPLSFVEFTQSTESPEYLAQAFIRNYERPANQTQPLRSTQAKYWWDNLTGTGTIDPGGGGGDDGGGVTPTTPTQEKQVITLLLTDALHGWRN
jgi:N-acetylmuramoyl-L-alanine amidase